MASWWLVEQQQILQRLLTDLLRKVLLGKPTVSKICLKYLGLVEQLVVLMRYDTVWLISSALTVMLLDKCDEDDLWYSRPENPLNSDPQEPELVVTKHDFRTDGYNIQMIVNIVDLYLSMTWYVSISDLQMFNICLHITTQSSILNSHFAFQLQNISKLVFQCARCAFKPR